MHTRLKITRFFVHLFAFVLLPALAAGCTTVTLVPAYDEQIDAGLTSLYADTSSFVTRMIAHAGRPEGTYDRNQDFYADVYSRIDSLTVRAQAHRVLKDCPSMSLVARALDLARIPADVKGEIGNLPKDECQVILMQMIKNGFMAMENIHRLRGDKGFPPEAQGQFLDGGVGARLRAAITVEVAKRGK